MKGLEQRGDKDNDVDMYYNTTVDRVVWRVQVLMASDCKPSLDFVMSRRCNSWVVYLEALLDVTVYLTKVLLLD